MAGLNKIRSGFCTINPNATTGKGILPEFMDKFLGQICKVMEFDSEGGVLVLAVDGSALGMFDKEDVLNSFECDMQGDVILPPNLNTFEQMAYYTKLTMRLGGYGPMVRSMVIVGSLHKGVYTDGFLFQKQNEQEAQSKQR